MADRARFVFVAKESDSGQPWIVAEPRAANLPILQSGTLGFELMDGLSLEDAQTVATYLNEHMTGLIYTPIS